MKYDVGTLVILDDPFTGNTYTGLISSCKLDNNWEGGGFYLLNWNQQMEKKISFSLLDRWCKNGEAEVYNTNK